MTADRPLRDAVEAAMDRSLDEHAQCVRCKVCEHQADAALTAIADAFEASSASYHRQALDAEAKGELTLASWREHDAFRYRLLAGRIREGRQP